MHLLAILFCAVAFLFLSATAQAAPLEGGVDPKRIAEIASQLPDDTFAFGPKITDRAAWDKLAHHPAFAKVIATAENKLKQPMPAMTEEIYSLYKTTGKRTKQYGDVRSDRHNRIAEEDQPLDAARVLVGLLGHATRVEQRRNVVEASVFLGKTYEIRRKQHRILPKPTVGTTSIERYRELHGGSMTNREEYPHPVVCSTTYP